MTALAWLKGLAAAIISSVANSTLAVIGCNATGSPLNWSQISTVATTSAIIGAALYLKQSPIPDNITTTKVNVVKNFDSGATTLTATTTSTTSSSQPIEPQKPL